MRIMRIAVTALVAALAAPLPLNVLLPQTVLAQETKDTKADKPKREPSAGMKAWHERQKKCGAEWREAKAAGKIEKGQTWPKFLSACNKRLKGS
ncbi:MAG TPA: hypothetical protein VHA55_00025 [Pseudorhodoplanes sp.]|nr:hypothetical protein [Pseudorhodoplanes sp.]